MKAFKTIISIIFIVGVIAIIIYDGRTQDSKSEKVIPSKSDTTSHLIIKK